MNPQKTSVLVVDDEPLKRTALQIDLGEAGYDVADAADAKVAARILESRSFDVVVTDLCMPGMDGIALLDEIKRRWPDTYVILMTAYGTVDTAVAAMKRGAYDYVTKPFQSEALLEKLDRVRAYRQTEQATPAGDEPATLGSLVGPSHRMRLLFEQVRAAGSGREPVLISGEPGTGKTVIAETIHQLVVHRAAPIRVNCEALTDRGVEGELFGIDASAGGGSARPGALDRAAGGTLLLENVDRLSPAMQAKLVQALDSARRGAGAEDGPGDVRIVSTTKATLLEAVNRGAFREDLYYRLSARSLSVPALRDRKDDIPALVRAFIAKHATLAGGAVGQTVPVAAHALDLLVTYHWPGNVMELEHAIEQALTRCGGGEIRPEHLPPAVCEADPREVPVAVPEVGLGLNQTVSDVEKTLIEAALRQSSGNQARAAQILKIPRTTLRDKMAKYGLVGDAPVA